MHTPHHDDPDHRNLDNESGEETSQQPKAGLEQEESAAGVLGGKKKDSDPPTGSKLSDLIYILDEDVPDDGSTAAATSSTRSESDDEKEHSGIGPLADVPGTEYLEDDVAPSPSISYDNLPTLPDDSLSEHEDTVVTNIEQLRSGGLDFDHDPHAGTEAEDAFDGLFSSGDDDHGLLGGNAPERGEDFYTHDRPPTPEELASSLSDETDDLYGGADDSEEVYIEDDTESYETEEHTSFDAPQSWYEEDELLPEANLVLVSSRHSVIPWTVGLIVAAIVCFGVGGYLYQKRLASQEAWTGNEASTATSRTTASTAATTTTPALPPLAPQQNADLGTGLGLVIAKVTSLPFTPVEAPATDVQPTEPIDTTPSVVAITDEPTDPGETSGGNSFPETARPPIDDPSLSGDFIRSVPEPSPQAERIRQSIPLNGDVSLTLKNNNVFRGVRVYDMNASMIALDTGLGLVTFSLEDVESLVPREGTHPIHMERDQPVASGRKGAISVEFTVPSEKGGESPTLIAAESDLVSAIHVDVARALGEDFLESEPLPTDGAQLAQPLDAFPSWTDQATSTDTTPADKQPVPPAGETSKPKSSPKPKKSGKR